MIKQKNHKGIKRKKTSPSKKKCSVGGRTVFCDLPCGKCPYRI